MAARKPAEYRSQILVLADGHEFDRVPAELFGPVPATPKSLTLLTLSFDAFALWLISREWFPALMSRR